MSQFIKIAEIGDVPPGSIRAVDLDGRRILLVNLKGAFFAVDARCPHQAGPLDEGTLWGEILECPWHHYRYDIRTGENLYPKNVYPSDLPFLQQDLRPLRTYRVKVEGEDILVEARPAGSQGG